MVNRSTTPQDPTARAMRGLDAVLHDDAIPDDLVIIDETLLKNKKREEVPTPNTSSATPICEESDVPVVARDKARVLFISYEDDVFVEGSVTQKRYQSYGHIFEEVHIIIFGSFIHEFSGLQIAQNVWAYPTNSRYWWAYPYDAYQIAGTQLYFADAFRADVVIAQDPYELAFAAYCIATRYRRALVICTSEDLYDPYFLETNEDNGYRAWWARFVLPRANRIFVEKERTREMVLAHHRISEGIVDIVPKYIDIASLQAARPSFTLKERYPKFTFTLLVVATLVKEEKIDFIINAAQHTLHQYPSMGLIIVGSGPELKALQTLVREKKLMNNVVFEVHSSDYVSFMHSAGMLLSLTENSTTEEVLMSAAAVGLPVITTSHLSLESVFVNGESSIVCLPGDIGCVIKGIGTYITDSVLRLRYTQEALDRLTTLVKGSAQNNLTLLRQSVEKAVSVQTVPLEVITTLDTM